MPVPVGRPEEVAEKTARVRSLLDRLSLKGILLHRSSNVAWLTGGRHTHVGLTAEGGVARALVTADKLYLLTNRIEAPRMEREERLDAAGFEFVVTNWYEPLASATELAGGPVGLDGPSAEFTDVAAEIAPLRYSLTPDEIERYRWLGKRATKALQNTAKSLIPGMTEDQIAGQLSGAIVAEGMVMAVCLVATDERIFQYRHPLPGRKRLDRYGMLVIGARRWGLHISATRLVYFGTMPADLRRKAEATARIDATFITETRPGVRIADVFKRGQRAYADAGYPDEWQLHHQGGACGYNSRDYMGTPSNKAVVVNNQAFAWNPSIAGTKSEDTILVTDEGQEILSYAEDWPTWTFVMNKQACRRPVVLEIT
jgi:Xaa-Pro aminopeptidase